MIALIVFPEFFWIGEFVINNVSGKVADYSQVELRILASMSGDSGLIESYSMAEDIHRITASKVFGIPFDEVTPEKRRDAKAVNFGIVYGQTRWGLASSLKISIRSHLEELS